MMQSLYLFLGYLMYNDGALSFNITKEQVMSHKKYFFEINLSKIICARVTLVILLFFSPGPILK